MDKGEFSSTEFKETPNTKIKNITGGLWVRRSIVERETAQIIC
jgi:hypothetical protein